MTFLLIAVDPSPASRNAVMLGAHLAAALGAGVRLVHVLEPQFVPVSEIPPPIVVPEDVRHKEALDLMASATASAREKGIPVETRIETGNAADRLVEAAAERDVEMIVLGRHGRSAISRLVLGSVSEAVMRQSGKPVVLTH